jgi:predicted GIY-YIG superfamily endonuclease
MKCRRLRCIFYNKHIQRVYTGVSGKNLRVSGNSINKREANSVRRLNTIVHKVGILVLLSGQYTPEAIAAENLIKGGSRQAKIALINSKF